MVEQLPIRYTWQHGAVGDEQMAQASIVHRVGHIPLTSRLDSCLVSPMPCLSVQSRIQKSLLALCIK